MVFQSIPVVNIENVGLNIDEGSISNSDFLETGDEISQALSDIGFVYLKNHGIDMHLVQNVFNSSKTFFTSPREEKLKHLKTEKQVQGFVDINQEKLLLATDESAFSKEIRECFNFIGAKDHNIGSIELYDVLTSLAEKCMDLSIRLLKAIEQSLDLPDDILVDAHKIMMGEGGGCVMRTLFYPAIEGKTPPGTVRCGTHSDYGTFTLLFQDNMGGLEVQDRNGEWQKAKPIDGTILVNVGDLLEKWTSGKFLATKHRVLVPKDELLKKTSRQSIVFFFLPDDHVMVEPFDGDVVNFPPYNAAQYISDKNKLTYGE